MQHINDSNNIEFNTDEFEDTDLQEANNRQEKIMSILQKEPSKASVLKPVIQFLMAVLEPSKIFILPYNFDRTVSNRYFDLLFVVPGSLRSFRELESAINIPYIKSHCIHCSLHNEEKVIEGVSNANPLYVLNFLPKYLVYDNTSRLYPVTTPEQLEAIRAAAMEIFMKGFEKARGFYSCAEQERNNRPELSLFMLHQATELTCRAVLQSLNGDPIKEHKIRIFKKHIRRLALPLFSIFNDDTRQETELFDTLEKGYQGGRYDNDFKVNRDTLQLLFDRVKLFQTTAYEVVKQKTSY